MVSELDLQYPSESCPFCGIASAFPHPPSSPSSSALWSPPSKLIDSVPNDQDAPSGKTDPASFVVLAAEEVVAFLDILPMTPGHLLVATRRHVRTVDGMRPAESRDVGFWLPVLARVVSKVTGVTDYNIVQNNGARAAQVVPHVHFHIIPRPETMPEIKSKSWTMFGRGKRDELDDDDGEKLAAEMRQALREEIERIEKTSSSSKL